MPGRVDMDQQGAVGSLDLKKDRSHAQIAQSAPAVQGHNRRQPNGLAPTNGSNGALQNGLSAHDATIATVNGEANTSFPPLADPANPPPLDQSWRHEMTNKSLGKLLSRVSHQCFVELNDTLSRMSAVEEEAQKPQVNGVLQATADTSEVSLNKKRMLIEFASSQRDRFIKLLVLSDTSRNQEDQARMIDVFNWQTKQWQSYDAALEAIGRTKLKMNEIKVPSPNIEGALELLATGKSSKTPHLGYIPPEKASAKELLQTLRDMNVIIATRLSLNDELSPHMQDYSVADGRVTFKVPGEFEVDLSVGDDDPESQFFFLDLRLTFKPSTGAISDTLRNHLESRINHALMEKGLPGCYDFLHNFVLTHKINLLRSQVSELVQGKWFDCIRAENLRRSLTVQYWIGRPGPKSWLEIGISSGKVKGRHSRRPTTPCLSVRWFRRGVEVKDEPLDFDWSELSLERCLSTVIAKHTAWLLGDLESRIRDLAPTDSVTDVRRIEESAARRVLTLSLPCMQSPLHLRIENVTGQYSISPPSGPTARAERHMNNDPTADAAQWLTNTLCAVAQERVHKGAEVLQWAPVPQLQRQDNLQRIFGNDLRAHSTFLPSKAWGEHWTLAVTFSLSGEVWWAAALEEKRDDQGNVTGKIISSARRVRQAHGSSEADAASRKVLLQIERAAVVEIAFGALSTQLTDLQVPHRIEQTPVSPPSGAGDARASVNSTAVMYFAPANLLRQSRQKHGQTWAGNVARLTHHGMIDNWPDETGVRHDLRVVLEGGKMKQLKKHLTNFKDRNLVLSEDGAVSLRILAPFGKPFADQIRSRMQSIERLDRYIRALQKYGLECSHVSLSRLTFTYSTDPELSATVLFPSEQGMPIRLKLQPRDINPHARIRVLLEKGLNQTGDHGVEAIGFILLLTHPLLQAFERLEAGSSASRHAISVQPQTSTRYLLKYSSPLPACTFEIRSRLRREGKQRVAFWHVQLKEQASDTGSAEAKLPEDFVKALRQEIWSAKGEHWLGVGNGVMATIKGIQAAVERLDGVVRRFEGSKPKAEDGTKEKKGAESQANAKDGEQGEKKGLSGSQQQPANASGSTSSTGAAKKEQPHDVIMLD